MLKRICLTLCLLLSAQSLYASSMDHAVFSIGNSEIEIRWGMGIDDFHDLGKLYDVLSLIASNYNLIHSQKKIISFQYFKEGDKYLLSYSIDNKQDVEIYTEKFSKTMEIIKEVLIKNFDLKDSVPESTNLLLMAIPTPLDNKYPDYSKFFEFYVGPAPGTMQAKENGQWYELYFFFKEENIFKLIKKIKQEQSFSRAILIKKEINRNNIGKIESLK